MSKFQKELITKITSIDNEKSMLLFLETLLTSKELEDMCTRMQIIKRLLKGDPQREIASDLKVGIATVTRGSIQIKNTNNKSWWTSLLWR